MKRSHAYFLPLISTPAGIRNQAYCRPMHADDFQKVSGSGIYERYCVGADARTGDVASRYTAADNIKRMPVKALMIHE